ncbi:MAG: hypothetical protein KGJ36_05765 [Acidobacteriota bacterium]|nr:hypothetical protein [Acidobacteriota bacterium]
MAPRAARSVIPFALLGALGLASLVTIWASVGSSGAASSPGPEGVVVFHVPDLAPATTTATGAPVDGVTCQSEAKEVVKYHIHVAVALFVNGARERLPAGVGITRPYLVEHFKTGTFLDVGPYNCLYWLHTHAADGIVHVEAPAKGAFTLGQLFDVWRQPLGAERVGPARGRVVVYENGRRLSGDPRVTPLLPHGVIQIDVGSPVVAFQPFTYRVTGGCGQGTTGCSSSG